jgi:hypothetical protein
LNYPPLPSLVETTITRSPSHTESQQRTEK